MGQQIQLGALSTSMHQEPRPIRIKHPDKCSYIVGGKGFFNEKRKLCPPGSLIRFDGEPNLDLHPVTKPAWDKMQEFLDKLDNMGKLKAKKDGRDYTPLPRTPWLENGEVAELPTPKYLMNAPTPGEDIVEEA